MELKLVNNLPILHPEGALDAQGCLTFQLQLAMVLKKSPELCAIDMTNVDAINSTGLHLLAASLKTASEQRCRLVLCNIQAPVRMVFEISRLDSIFEIYESTDVLLTHGMLKHPYRSQSLIAA